MQDRTDKVLKALGRAAVHVVAALLLAIVSGASAGIALFCLGWWVLG